MTQKLYPDDFKMIPRFIRHDIVSPEGLWPSLFLLRRNHARKNFLREGWLKKCTEDVLLASVSVVRSRRPEKHRFECATTPDTNCHGIWRMPLPIQWLLTTDWCACKRKRFWSTPLRIFFPNPRAASARIAKQLKLLTIFRVIQHL